MVSDPTIRGRLFRETCILLYSGVYRSPTQLRVRSPPHGLSGCDIVSSPVVGAGKLFFRHIQCTRSQVRTASVLEDIDIELFTFRRRSGPLNEIREMLGGF
ncbi:hypothetical protein JAAARDRAFT_619043 [Jaapia argillacea MUCL 33604]|uniref:Uncharacterized protein n=1 Tax=Jaapia argillacea MUCL 33604 TaxID=933084 RepID=A0A067P4H7_9AGAM|nr:hypothetical protein JAAARDRAFT_619043 [Jaapia argillacea MUCL 33604]